ncbi:hypothetical protein ACTUVN_002344 [Pseudomonas caspiana]
MSIKFSFQKSAQTSFVVNKEAATFHDLFDRYLSQPRYSEDKDGQTFVPSFFRAPERIASNVVATSLVIFDVDQKPEDDIVTLEEAEDALIDMHLEHAIYTSYSNTADCPRYRIVIPISRPVYPEEYLFVAAALLEELDELLDGRLAKVIDGCWRETARCYFTFTVHPDRRNGSISFYNAGRPADADELKLHQSTYAIDNQYTKTQKPRTPGTAVGAQGRSMELNRILSGMFRSTTEQQIVERLMQVDQEMNQGDEYFRDPQYARNKPRAGENQTQASLRSCKSFVRSHLNWLKRKIKPINGTIVNQKASSKEPMPTHEAMVKLKGIKEQKTKSGGDSTLVEFQLMSGEHAGRHVWHRLYGEGNHPTAIKISKEMIDSLGRSAKLEVGSLKDLIKAEGKIVRARIKNKPGTNGYPAQNEIGAFL